MISSIKFENIIKSYKNSKFVLDIPCLEFSHDKINVIVGPNGSGKSTLLNLIAQHEKPDSGHITIYNEHEVLKNNGSITRKKIGFVPQNPYLFNMSVFENIALGLKIRKYARHDINFKVSKILADLKIDHLKFQRIQHLSAGERQKVAIAQIIVLNTKMILLDEPTACIDQQNAFHIEAILKKLNGESNSLVILTTHSLNQAFRLSSRIISIAAGKFVDFVHENVFSGILYECHDGLKSLKIRDDIEIILATNQQGAATIAVDPGDIMVSRHLIKTSARNHFKGKIITIESLGTNVRLGIDIGTLIYAIITKQSVKELKIGLDSGVYINFKVNSVRVI